MDSVLLNDSQECIKHIFINCLSIMEFSVDELKANDSNGDKFNRSGTHMAYHNVVHWKISPFNTIHYDEIDISNTNGQTYSVEHTSVNIFETQQRANNYLFEHALQIYNWYCHCVSIILSIYMAHIHKMILMNVIYNIWVTVALLFSLSYVSIICFILTLLYIVSVIMCFCMFIVLLIRYDIECFCVCHLKSVLYQYLTSFRNNFARFCFYAFFVFEFFTRLYDLNWLEYIKMYCFK